MACFRLFFYIAIRPSTCALNNPWCRPETIQIASRSLRPNDCEFCATLPLYHVFVYRDETFFVPIARPRRGAGVRWTPLPQGADRRGRSLPKAEAPTDAAAETQKRRPSRQARPWQSPLDGCKPLSFFFFCLLIEIPTSLTLLGMTSGCCSINYDLLSTNPINLCQSSRLK